MKRFALKDTGENNLLSLYGDIHRISRIFYLFSLLIVLGLVAGIIILLTHQDWIQAVFLGGCLPMLWVGFRLISKKEFEKATVFLTVILFLMLTVIATSGLGIHHLSNIAFPALLILASLVIRRRTFVFLTLFAILCSAWLVFGELFGWYQPKALVASVPGDFFSMMVILVATSLMVRILVDALFTTSREVQKELGDRLRAEERLAYDALHDSLTGLPNRALFLDRLGQRFEHSLRHPDDPFVVLFIDLDRLKVVNDSLGHAVGDQLLIATAARLAKCVRPEDTVSRLGGDEFAILVNGFTEVGDIIHLAVRIQGALSSSPLIENLDRMTTASIGIAIFNDRYSEPQQLLRDADAAMYRAKSQGGDQYALFDDTMHANAMALLHTEAELKHAVENQELQVFYQPIVEIASGKIAGVEALVRWSHPRQGTILPEKFIGIAEETGLILSIGEFVLNETCRQVLVWRANGNPTLWASVNLSGRQFHDKNVLSMVTSALSATNLPGQALQFEITESVAMKDLAYSTRLLQKLAQLGIQIALDDFGNGYSALGYLNRFPIKTLKIDPSFIREITINKNSKAIATAIISMAHALDMEVVAEGVETDEQLSYLRTISCDKVQGYHFSPALTAAALEKIILKHPWL